MCSGWASCLLSAVIYTEFMASDGSPVRNAREKKKKKKAERSGTDRADVEETDAQLEIQRLTAAGHAALQSGDNNAALQSFRSALKAATKVPDTLWESEENMKSNWLDNAFLCISQRNLLSKFNNFF